MKNDFLREVDRIVTERADQYGPPEVSLDMIARYWSVAVGVELTSAQVSQMMILLKLARIQTGQPSEDTLLDIVGYSFCLDRCLKSEEQLDKHP